MENIGANIIYFIILIMFIIIIYKDISKYIIKTIKYQKYRIYIKINIINNKFMDNTEGVCFLLKSNRIICINPEKYTQNNKRYHITYFCSNEELNIYKYPGIIDKKETKTDDFEELYLKIIKLLCKYNEKLVIK